MLSAAAFGGCALIKAAGNSVFYSNFPSGFFAKEEHFDPDGFQDYTDYCKYLYKNAEGFEKDARFMPVSDFGVDKLKGYFDNFRGWMEIEDRLGEYDFDPSVITPDDLVQVEAEVHFSDYDNYDVYFFDRGTNTLYYIHQNI